VHHGLLLDLLAGLLDQVQQARDVGRPPAQHRVRLPPLREPHDACAAPTAMSDTREPIARTCKNSLHSEKVETPGRRRLQHIGQHAAMLI